jgi:formate dehydrogenase subunit gamma
MTNFLGRWKIADGLRAFVLIALLAFGAGTAFAQAPAELSRDNNPTARPMTGLTAPSEADMLRALQGVQGNVTIPDRKAGTLVQPQGRDWRDSIRGSVAVWGAWFVLGMLCVLIAFYMLRGTIMIEGGRSGRTIERFNGTERFVHWLTASSFVVLAITGLNVAYGRYLLLPILGPDGFSSWSIAAKWAHNFVAFPFMIGIALMLFIWVAHNIPNRYDLEWIKQGGGMFTRGAHPPARKFNAGQKVIFWSVILGGAVISFSGLYLLFPFYFGGMDNQQFMVILHSIVSLILVAIILAHIYIGTLGMEGAWDAMYTGDVDERWARDHHGVWVAEMKGGGGDD